MGVICAIGEWLEDSACVDKEDGCERDGGDDGEDGEGGHGKWGILHRERWDNRRDEFFLNVFSAVILTLRCSNLRCVCCALRRRC